MSSLPRWLVLAPGEAHREYTISKYIWHFLGAFILSDNTWHSFMSFDILSDILSGVYTDILSAWYLFWHSFRHSIWDLFWHSIFWHLFRRSVWQNFDILSGICIWYIFWHSFWLVYRMFFVVEVRWGTLRSSRWRSAGNALILKLRWRSVRRRTLRSSQRLQLRSGGDHSSDPVLAVRVWRRTLRSSACSWGPAGITPLILCLLFGSGGEHCDLALAVEVQRGSLWSWACCSSPAGNNLILTLWWRSGRDQSDPELAVGVRRRSLRSSQRLQLRSGGEHSDPVLAVRVWRRTLRSSACSWGPADRAEAEKDGGTGDMLPWQVGNFHIQKQWLGPAAGFALFCTFLHFFFWHF